MNLENYLEIDEEVYEALLNNKPIVSLESTIISHGMPYPKNYETALEVEQTVRDNGAIPATIAIINGKLKVGLTKDEINYLAKEGEKIPKVSRRDIPYILANNLSGATTVASTMIISELAGIRIFATGGIGGVHREAHITMDISADLEELAMTNVVVVCAGAKSILDLPLTLEYLETKGVPVLGYQTEELPAFYTRSSGYKLDYAINTPDEFAKIIKTKYDIGLNGGIVVANPIPNEYSLNESDISNAIETSLRKASDNNIIGKKITPFLLEEIQKITKGASLEANIKLVLNNAILASEISKKLCLIEK